ncbi:MAG: prepilin-type N-terminal cleavage/methylation domain-containing protein [Planctomycetota bacterium]
MPSARARGFTILEIMVAIAVLVIGILGVIAMFPVAIKLGKRVILDTNSVIIAQSVEQAIREGLAHRKGQRDEGKQTYFLFYHSGVETPLPSRILDASPSDDNFILLPMQEFESRSSTVSRDNAYLEGKVFVYPETDGLTWTFGSGGDVAEYQDAAAGTSPNGGGDARRADNDGDDYTVEVANGESYTTFAVMKTFPMSEDFLRGLRENADAEFGDDENSGTEDPLGRYSYAFAIRRALSDSSLGRHSRDEKDLVPANELFEVEIMVFHGFIPNTTYAQPVFRTTVLMHK